VTHSFKKVSKNPVLQLVHPATPLIKAQVAHDVGQGEQTLVAGLRTVPAGQEV